jgi:hypothetical protein
MDASFFRHAQTGFASRSAARLDYGVLIATLEAMQSASATAKAVRGLTAEPIASPRQDSLAELVLGGPRWREAIAAQAGSFNPERAQQLRKMA